MSAPPLHVPVLIVGGGPAGLATSILLGRWGVRSLLVERHAGPAVHPKATGISTRTMELFRQWGLEDDVRARAVGARLEVSVRETLAAPERERRSIGYPDVDRALRVSPTAPAVLAQDALEPLLLDLARRASTSDVRFGHELLSLDPRPDGVAAAVRDRDGGAGSTVLADYVVAADGAWSPTRRMCGIAAHGAERMGEYLSILFRADLAELTGATPCALYTLTATTPPAVLVPTSRDGRWVLAQPWDSAREPIATLDGDRLVALVRRAAGAPDLAVAPLDARSVALGATVAERFRAGRVFLVGDAAHRMTPSGGMGMNTAIHDAHNLAWKLAAVLQGWAGPALLDSYEAERRPVAERNVARSCGRHPELSGIAVDLGVAYATPDPVTRELHPAAADEALAHVARVGARAPHAWLTGSEPAAAPAARPSSSTCSTLDLADGRFVLLAGARGASWCRAAERIGEARQLPLSADVVGPDAALRPRSDDAWRAAYRIGDEGAVLLRPDGHVAWLTDGPAVDPEAALTRALGGLLAWPAAPDAPRRPSRAQRARASRRASADRVAR